MPVYNLTLDDTSPLWTYASWWKDGDKNDKSFNLYYNSSFHATNTTGATVSLRFNGTGVYLFGAKRDNHDDYAVTLDRQGIMANGHAPLPNNADDFQQPLFTHGDLTPGEHTVVLSNEPSKEDAPWLDLDYGIITLGDGDDSTVSTDEILDDTSPNITYSTGWDSTPNQWSSLYWGSTMHRTNATNAAASITFYGSAVTAFGAVSGNHGLYTVALDGSPAQPFTGLSSDFHPQQVLFAASGLASAEHQLVITNIGKTWEFFDIDYVVVSSWVDKAAASGAASGAAPSSTSSGTAASSSSHATPVGAIAGGIVGGVLGIALLVLLIFLLLRRRRRLQQIPDAKSEVLPTTTPSVPPSAFRSSFGPQSSLDAVAATTARTGSNIGNSEAHTNLHPGSTAGGTYRGSRQLVPNRREREEHVDLPPPAYDQVLRNRALAASIAAGMDSAVVTSGPHTPWNQTSGAPIHPNTGDLHADSLGNTSPEKEVERGMSAQTAKPLHTHPHDYLASGLPIIPPEKPVKQSVSMRPAPLPSASVPASAAPPSAWAGVTSPTSPGAGTPESIFRQTSGKRPLPRVPSSEGW